MKTNKEIKIEKAQAKAQAIADKAVEEIFSDDAKLVHFSSAANAEDLFLEGLTIHYTCQYNGLEWHVALQNTDRNNGMEAYTQWGMSYAISYGYENIKPVPPTLAATGKELDAEVASRRVAEVMAGMGLQEVLSYTLTNMSDIFKKMNMAEAPAVEIENVISANWSVFRTWLLPGLLEFLAKNKHVEYPQRIFETGVAIIPDPSQETKARDTRKLACCLSSPTAGYEDVSSLLDALLSTLGVKYELRQASHPSFISGRTAAVFVSGKEIGFVGEVHPAVLNNWGLEKPVTAFELATEDIMK